MNRIINTIAVPKKIKIGVVQKIFRGGWWLFVRIVKKTVNNALTRQPEAVSVTL